MILFSVIIAFLVVMLLHLTVSRKSRNNLELAAKNINPLLPIAHKSAQIDKISILKLEGIIKKISYERRDYESVDEKSLSKAMSRKTTKKRIQALKG